VDIVDLEHEVVQITVAVSLAFNDFDTVINPFHLSRRDGEVEVIEDTHGMPA